MEDEYGVRSSLDFQIREAKSRAELFSKSLQDARAQEAIALKILEQERERWAHSFEEKSILIEQLERELTSTVEALDAERSHDKQAPPAKVDHKVPLSSEINVLTEDDVGKSFHRLMDEIVLEAPPAIRAMQELNRGTVLPTYAGTQTTVTHPGHLQNETFRATNFSHHHASPAVPNGAYHQPQETASIPQRPTAPPALPAVHAGHPHQEASPQRQLNGTSAPSVQEDNSIWRDLLAQYQEQLKLTKMDLVACMEEKDKYSRQVVHLEKQVRQLSEEKELFATACENAEGKLKFRAAQVTVWAVLCGCVGV